MPAKTKAELQEDLSAAHKIIDYFREQVQADIETVLEYDEQLQKEQRLLLNAIDQMATGLYSVIKAADESWYIPKKIRGALDEVRDWFIEDSEDTSDLTPVDLGEDED